MPVGTGEFDLALGITLDREGVRRALSPYATVVDADTFWEPREPGGPPVVCAELRATAHGTLVSGLVRPGLDAAGLLALARGVARDGDHPVLIDDVTFLGDCRGHVLLVHPDGGLAHVVRTARGHRPVALDTQLVRLPEPGAIRLRVRRDCGTPH